VTGVLHRLAPSLRVAFAGLAKISFEHSRTVPPTLPKGFKNKKVNREGATWITVPGHVSFAYWRKFCTALNLCGLDIREMTLCFTSSVMCVIDGHSEEGRVKERHLPFEGFLEALVRLATAVPLPTEAMLANAEMTHAGPYMARLEASADKEEVEAMIKAQACEWSGVPDSEAGGEMPRRVEHLADVILRKLKQLKEDAMDEPLTTLTRREFRQWALRGMGVGERMLPEPWTQEVQLGEA